MRCALLLLSLFRGTASTGNLLDRCCLSVDGWIVQTAHIQFWWGEMAARARATSDPAIRSWLCSHKSRLGLNDSMFMLVLVGIRYSSRVILGHLLWGLVIDRDRCLPFTAVAIDGPGARFSNVVTR